MLNSSLKVQLEISVDDKFRIIPLQHNLKNKISNYLR